MRDPWRKTFELCRSHALLWVLYILAQLLVTFLWWFRGIANKGIYEWFTTRRSVSVFGVIQTTSSDYNDRVKAALAYIPLGFGTGLACLVLFVFALVVTSKLVAMVLAEREPDLMAALKASALRWRSILGFSVKSFIAVPVIFAIFIFPMVFFLLKVCRTELVQDLGPVSIVVLIPISCAAWLLIPATVRLLSTSELEVVSTKTHRHGALVAIVAIAATSVIFLVIPRLEAGLQLESRAALIAVSVVHGLLINSAFAPLFVALSVLSSEQQA
jgi:hypothetical protein